MKIHASMSLGGGGDRTSCPLRVAICRAVGARWQPSAAGRLPECLDGEKGAGGLPWRSGRGGASEGLGEAAGGLSPRLTSPAFARAGMARAGAEKAVDGAL